MDRNDKHDLGRREGVWIPVADVETHLANGWSIADPHAAGGHVLMAPVQDEQGRAA
jgi:hypothetical protein